MELHPFLEKSIGPSLGLWYVLNLDGEGSSKWVGPACAYVPNPQGHNGHVYVTGGTDPSGSFSDVRILDLDAFSWSSFERSGLQPRYEHSAFTSNNKLYVFGGANQEGNHSSIQCVTLPTGSAPELSIGPARAGWTMLAPGGASAPSARTYHTMGHTLGDTSRDTTCETREDKFVVYSGGQIGSEPVKDKQVHVYDVTSNAWERPKVKGTPPKPRHGHLVVCDRARNCVLVHGGMAGSIFYDDLHVLEVKGDEMSWRQVTSKRGQPNPGLRAAHAGAIDGDYLYVFGGMNKDGCLDDTWKLNLVTHKWSAMLLDCPPPTTRLDHCCCIVKLSVPPVASDSEHLLATSQHAVEVLDTKLRLGSAGSMRSTASAGSMRSTASAGSERSHHSVGSGHDGKNDHPSSPELSCSPFEANTPSPTTEGAAPIDVPSGAGVEPTPGKPSDDTEQMSIVTLLMVIGGMDTEGNIFDDCLVLRVA